MQAAEALPLVASAKRQEQASESDAEEDPCWICLSSAGVLTRPCDCPRLCHRECIATWQLTNYGRREENFCRFCNKRLPALWKPDVEQSPPKEELRVAPVMAVRYNGPEGTREFKLRVKPGPEGLAIFKAHLKEILGFDVDSQFDVTFECQLPSTGSMLTLSGLNAYGAATHCAALLAASKTGPTTPDTPPSLHPTPPASPGASASAASVPVLSLPSSPGSPTASYGASYPQPHQVPCRTAHPQHPAQQPQQRPPQSPSLPALTPHQERPQELRSATAVGAAHPLSRRACQTGYVHHFYTPGCRRLAAPAGPAAGATPQHAGNQRAGSSGARWSYPRATWGTGMRAFSDGPARGSRGEIADPEGGLPYEDFDIDDLLPYSRPHTRAETPIVMPPVVTASRGSHGSGQQQQDFQQGSQLPQQAEPCREPQRQAVNGQLVSACPTLSGEPGVRPRPRSSPSGSADGRTQALVLGAPPPMDASLCPGMPPTPPRSQAPAPRRSTFSDRSLNSPTSPDRDRPSSVMSPASPSSVLLYGVSGAATAGGGGMGGSDGVAAPASSLYGLRPGSPQLRCPLPVPAQDGASRHAAGAMPAAQQELLPQLDQGQTPRRGGHSPGRLHLPQVIKSTAKRTVGSLLRALRHATR